MVVGRVGTRTSETKINISVTKWCVIGYGPGALWDL